MIKLNGTSAPLPQSPKLAISFSTTKIQPHLRATIQSAKSSLSGAPLPNLQKLKGFKVSRNLNLTPNAATRNEGQTAPIRIDPKKVQTHSTHVKGRVIAQLTNKSLQVSNTPLTHSTLQLTNMPASQPSNSSFSTHLQLSKLKHSPSLNLLQSAFNKSQAKVPSSTSLNDLKLPQRTIQKFIHEQIGKQTAANEEPVANLLIQKKQNVIKPKLTLPENKKLPPTCITPIAEIQKQRQIIQFPPKVAKNESDPLKLPVFKQTPANLVAKNHFKKTVVSENGGSLNDLLQVKNSSENAPLSQLEHLEVINRPKLKGSNRNNVLVKNIQKYSHPVLGNPQFIMSSINVNKQKKILNQDQPSGQNSQAEQNQTNDFRVSSDIMRDHLEQPHHLETSRQEVIDEDRTKEDCDTTIFSFTFNKEEHQKQVNDETVKSQRQIFSNSFKVDNGIDLKLSIQNEHTHSRTPQLIKIQGKQNNRNCQLDLQYTEQAKRTVLKKIEFEQFSTKNRPISQVQVRHVANDGFDNNYSDEYSYNSKGMSNGGDYIKVVQSRASSSKVRPTSGMQHYLKGKLPDCFLIESSPLSRKQPSQMNEGYAYIESAAIESSSPFTVKATSDEQNTRLHSAQTQIRNSTTDGDNQSKQRLSVISNKPPLIPNLGNPKRLMSGNSATQASYMNNGSMQTTGFKKPIVSKQVVGNLYNKNDQRLMQEILQTSLSTTLMNPDQFERAAPNTSYTERY